MKHTLIEELTKEHIRPSDKGWWWVWFNQRSIKRELIKMFDQIEQDQEPVRFREYMHKRGIGSRWVEQQIEDACKWIQAYKDNTNKD